MSQERSSFKVQSISLQSERYSEALDLSGVFASIDIYESLDKPYITADLIVNDDQNWYETYDILGGEKVIINFISDRDKTESATTKLVTKTFYVHHVFSRKRVNEYTQIIFLHLIEDIQYISNLQNVNKFYDGKGHEIIEKICEEFLGIELAKTDNPKDNQLYNLIVPNMSPLDAIKWVTNSLTTQNGFPFFVFSTFVGNKLVLRDLETLLSSEVINRQYPYTWSPSSVQNPNPAIARRAIKTMEAAKAEDLFKLIKNGHIGAKYTYLNTAAPDEDTDLEFDYDVIKDALQPAIQSGEIFKNQKNPPYSPSFKLNNIPFNELQSNHYALFGGSNPYRLTNLPLDNSKPNFPLALGEAYDEADYKLFISGKSIEQLLKKSPMNIGINGLDFMDGDHHYTIGNLLFCKFSKTRDVASPTEKMSTIDSKLSGNYLIYKARHMIKRENYDISFTIVKLGSMDANG